MKKLLTTAILMFLTNNAQAYLQVTWTQSLNPNARTHIVMSGAGYEGMGYQFQQVALAYAEKLHDTYPNEQVVMLGNSENSSNQSLLTGWAAGAIVTQPSSTMHDQEMIAVLKQYSQIATLILVDHNGPETGSSLQDPNYRFNLQTPHLADLATHFAPDAWAMLSGCNSGYVMAPTLSTWWHIPVFGSLTSTNFQQLFGNGLYYGNDSDMHPQGSWKSINSVGLSSPVTCPDGQCLRLKPDNHAYVGTWGNLGTGLGFYKLFCPGLSADSCNGALMHMARAWVSSTNFAGSPDADHLKQFLFDYFCPQDAYSTRLNSCKQNIAAAFNQQQLNYTPFASQTLQCTMDSCQTQISCTSSTCTLSDYATGSTTTYMDEVNAYIHAFQAQGGAFTTF